MQNSEASSGLLSSAVENWRFMAYKEWLWDKYEHLNLQSIC